MLKIEKMEILKECSSVVFKLPKEVLISSEIGKKVIGRAFFNT